MEQFVLAGDIGGTKTILGCFSTESGPAAPVHEYTYRTNEWTSFHDVVADYLGRINCMPAAACFGIAGPIVNRRAEITVNVRWPIDARDITDLFGHNRIDLINDMQAMAYGMLVLPESGMETINPGEPEPAANRGLIAAGTGLGYSLLVHNAGRWIAIPSEAGHVDFAPASEIEIDLLRYLWDIYGRISTERVLSGPGLYNIYKFLRDTGRGVEPAWLAKEMEAGDPSATVSKYGLNDEEELCARALDLFVQVYGAVAGDYAITTVARGGIYLGGGIPPKILPRLKRAEFMHGFTNKGRLSELVSQIPVKVILETKTPLYGAASYAMQALNQ
ncbi:glucokinase [bacterium]|nr:glucokinase [bacterium]